jgi:hypothetical protein
VAVGVDQIEAVAGIDGLLKQLKDVPLPNLSPFAGHHPSAMRSAMVAS